MTTALPPAAPSILAAVQPGAQTPTTPLQAGDIFTLPLVLDDIDTGNDPAISSLSELPANTPDGSLLTDTHPAPHILSTLITAPQTALPSPTEPEVTPTNGTEATADQPHKEETTTETAPLVAVLAPQMTPTLRAQTIPAKPTANFVETNTKTAADIAGPAQSLVTEPKQLSTKVGTEALTTTTQLPETKPDSSGQQSSKGESAPQNPTSALTSSNHASQVAPFRMEMLSTASPAPTQPQQSAQIAQNSAAIGTNAPQTVEGTADITVGLTDADRLDVTIAAPTVESFARLTARQPELLRDLSMIGAEVEAVRVELRGERGPDMSSTSLTADSGSRSGDRHMPQDHQRNGQNQTSQTAKAEQARFRITATDQANNEVATLATSAARIDRYA